MPMSRTWLTAVLPISTNTPGPISRMKKNVAAKEAVLVTFPMTTSNNEYGTITATNTARQPCLSHMRPANGSKREQLKSTALQMAASSRRDMCASARRCSTNWATPVGLLRCNSPAHHSFGRGRRTRCRWHRQRRQPSHSTAARGPPTTAAASFSFVFYEVNGLAP